MSPACAVAARARRSSTRSGPSPRRRRARLSRQTVAVVRARADARPGFSDAPGHAGLGRAGAPVAHAPLTSTSADRGPPSVNRRPAGVAGRALAFGCELAQGRAGRRPATVIAPRLSGPTELAVGLAPKDRATSHVRRFAPGRMAATGSPARARLERMRLGYPFALLSGLAGPPPVPARAGRCLRDLARPRSRPPQPGRPMRQRRGVVARLADVL